MGRSGDLHRVQCRLGRPGVFPPAALNCRRSGLLSLYSEPRPQPPVIPVKSQSRVASSSGPAAPPGTMYLKYSATLRARRWLASRARNRENTPRVESLRPCESTGPPVNAPARLPPCLPTDNPYSVRGRHSTTLGIENRRPTGLPTMPSLIPSVQNRISPTPLYAEAAARRGSTGPAPSSPVKGTRVSTRCACSNPLRRSCPGAIATMPSKIPGEALRLDHSLVAAGGATEHQGLRGRGVHKMPRQIAFPRPTAVTCVAR